MMLKTKRIFINKNILLWFANLTILFLFACSPYKNIPKGNYLLVKNKILIDDKNIGYDELSSLIKQKPNRKILGLVRFHLRAYQLANWGKETKIKKWLKNTIGEAPVILDTTYNKATVRQLQLYLNNKGYFESEISSKVRYKRKKAIVFYNIKANKPYLINKISYTSPDALVKSYIANDTNNTLLAKGNNLDIDILNKERERITRYLKSNGFYFFNKEYIKFYLDSALNKHMVNINVEIKPISVKDKNLDSLKIKNHKQYQLNKIYINPEYKISSDIIRYDTLKYSIHQRFAKEENNYYFLVSGKLSFNPKTLTQSIFLKSNQLYKIEDAEQTYNKLTELKNFKFINLLFEELPEDTNSENNYGKLNCTIQLSKSPKQSLNYEVEGTNSSGDYGIATNIIYQNRNMLKGAEIFSIKLKGAAEIQKTFIQSDTLPSKNNTIPFNTYEYGAEFSVDIPKFLLPVKQEMFPKYFYPKSRLSYNLNYQNRPDYKRLISNASFSYNWKENQFKQHSVSPFDISFVKITRDSLFDLKIKKLRDRKLISSYLDHMIVSLKYGFTYNNQKLGKEKNFSYFKANIESSGNVLTAIYSLAQVERNAVGYYSFLGVKYAQFIRADIDYRRFFIFNKDNSAVYRFSSGFGNAYGNMKALPFEKSFYSGGSNDLRAWSVRSVGPGSFYDSTKTEFDKTGDINITSNIEYRFKIYKIWNGAAFIDAANIWLSKDNELYPGGKFNFNSFYKEFAIGTGLGLRLNLTFFIIRIDAALPLRNPSMPINERWVLQSSQLKDIKYNLGIGYPF